MKPTLPVTTRFTRQSLHDLLQNRWESDVPDLVLAALRPFDGKPITTRLLAKLPNPEAQGWRLRREYGMTQLVNAAYYRTQGNDRDGISLHLAHTEASVPLSCQQVVDRNPAYFSARVERNHARMEAMNSAELLDRMVVTLNRVLDLRASLASAMKDFDQLADFGGPFNPDRYAFLAIIEGKEK